MRTGLERFLESPETTAALPRGARIGLVCHPATVDASLRHAADRLRERDDVRLVRLFGPEHGVRGEAQDMEPVREREDPVTGIPVVSLYGDDVASLAPRPGDLDGLDAIVHDLQDVGSRYYTFVYTLSYVMEAAGTAGIPVVVLDRPNPIGGTRVEGPVLDPGLASFVGRYPIPVRHGMTSGELAALFRDVFGVRCDLRVVAMEGWRRRMEFEETGLPWVLPSPNMSTVATARVYPGGCLLEGTNLSEGRGTTLPFELFGAPWLDAEGMERALRSAAAREGLPGFRPRAARFRPKFQKHASADCGGVQIHVTDRATFRPFETYLVALREARALAPAEFAWRTERYEFVEDRLAIDLLLGRSDLRGMLEAGAPLEEMEAAWADGTRAFRKTRERFLIYPD